MLMDAEEQEYTLGVDEDLTRLDEGIRRLKIDYEMYFNGGSPRPPMDTHWRVEKLVKQYSDSQKLNYAQRFRYNSLVQKFSVYNDLWRQKLRGREEGQGRFAGRGREEAPEDSITRILCRDPSRESEKVDQLLKAMVDAKRKCGESVGNLDPLAFKKFIQDKTKKLQKSLGCKTVQYVVSVEEGKAKLKAIRGED